MSTSILARNANPLLLAASLATLGGCAAGADSSHSLVRRRVAHMQTSTSQEDRSRCDASQPGREASQYDTNGDGLPDVRKVYQTVGEGTQVHSILVCREVDLNHDGTKDMFRFYDEEGRSIREEEDRDFDGRIDVITYFDHGEVIRREMDTNGDGFVDMRVYYRNRVPYRAERELTQDHSPEFHADYWEFYDATGHVTRMGWDYDHDGRADRWDRIDRVAPLRQASANASTATPVAGQPIGAQPVAAQPVGAQPVPAQPVPAGPQPVRARPTEPAPVTPMSGASTHSAGGGATVSGSITVH